MHQCCFSSTEVPLIVTPDLHGMKNVTEATCDVVFASSNVESAAFSDIEESNIIDIFHAGARELLWSWGGGGANVSPEFKVTPTQN